MANGAVADAVDRRGLDRVLYRCAAIDLEVLRGATSTKHFRELRDVLDGSFAELPITPDVMDTALDTQRKLVENGRHRGVALPELVIAACAEVHDATVVHYDGDYDLIAEVTGQPVEWVVSAGSVD